MHNVNLHGVFLRFSLLVALGSSALAAVPDLLVERAWTNDVRGDMSLPVAQVQPYRPFIGSLAGRERTRVFWLRLKLAPGVPGEQVALAVDPAFAGAFKLFDPLSQSSAEVRSASHFFTHRVFLVPRTTEPRTLWLRADTRIPVPIGVTAQPEAAGTEAEVRQTLYTGVSFGVTLLLAFWSLYQWRGEPEPVTRSFFVLLVLLLARELVRSGWLRWVLQGTASVEILEVLQATLLGIPLNSMIWFLGCFLAEYRPSRAGLRVLSALHLWLPAAALCLSAGRFDLAWRLGLTTLAATLLLALLLAANGGAWHDAGEIRPVFSRRVVCLWLGGMAAAYLWARTGSAMPSFDWHPYTPAFAPAFLALFFFTIMRARARRLASRHLEATMRLRLSDQELANEQKRLREQRDLLTMLTHELRTPLSVVRMVLGFPNPPQDVIAAGNRAVSDMNHVIEVCAQVDRFCDSEQAPSGDRTARCSLHRELDLLLEAHRGGPIHVYLDQTADEVHADPMLVRLILGNLLDNAVKYRAPGSAVEVTLRNAAGDSRGVELTVRNLPGPAGRPDAASLFRKYYRSPGAHRFTGSGLGLYLSSNLARRLGGELRYAPDAEKVEFVLCLPS